MCSSDLEERAAVPHHFIDCADPHVPYNAGEFGDDGRRIIAQIARRGNTPVVVGGSGLYIASLIDGLFQGPGADPSVRAALTARWHAEGIDALLADLRAADPETARTIDPTKPRRIIRALEVYRLTGEPLSVRQKREKIAVDFRPLVFGLSWDRHQLYARIERRCDDMLAQGLLDEVERLEKGGIDGTCTAMNSVGYAEALAYLHGRVSAREMVRLMKQNTRRYAKRQMTWFRRDPRIEWFGMDDRSSPETVAGRIEERYRAKCGMDA